MIIAIVGADGAGKTTTASKLVADLKLAHKEYKNVDFNKSFEDYFVIKYFLRLLPAKRKSVSQAIFFEKKAVPPTYIKLLWPLIIYLDQLFLLLYLRTFRRKVITVCDRYAYSYLITWQYYGMSNKLVEWLYVRFPKPDVCLVLLVDPETSMMRKKGEKEHRKNEYNLAFFTQHVEYYNKLAAWSGFFSVDSVKNDVSTIAESVRSLMVVDPVAYFCNPTSKHIINYVPNKNSLTKAFLNSTGQLMLKNLHSQNKEKYLACFNQEELDLQKTLEFLTKIQENTALDFMLFKSNPPFSQVRDDLDIYLPSKSMFEKLTVELEREGFIKTHEFGCEAHFDKEGYLQLDVHYFISWDYLGKGGSGPEYFSCELIWKRRHKVVLNGTNQFVPSVEDEILILCAHALIQHSYLTLGDILYIGELIRDSSLDFDYMQDTVRKFGWEKEYIQCVAAISTFYKLYWDIYLELPENYRIESNTKTINYPVYFIMPVCINCTMHKKLIRRAVYLYRYIYYFKLQGKLAFNPIPSKIRSLLL